ncbi:hypothetical protein Bca52824_013765 [Brassica carinata]|uniref:NmrA-like domain-containing protein n=1 Tax=Brassica carinata TaxID=52824 RepID=A0A8X7W089_BRACI|nr:hypothetical protein Bca52824_013765 [Brassica carinata]
MEGIKSGEKTRVLVRPEIGLDIEKVQLLFSFKKLGARLVEASFSDHQSLVSAVKLVDVVVSAMSGVHFRSHNILVQLKLVEAIKEAAVLPSEFGMDPPRMGHALPPGRDTFDQKWKCVMLLKLPEYLTLTLLALASPHILPETYLRWKLYSSKEKANIYGDGNVKVVFADEDDIAKYTAKTLDDPRTVNKTVYIRPQDNVLTQNELVKIWEKLTGNELEKTNIAAKDFLANIEHMEIPHQAGIGHFYHIFYEGCLTDHEVGDEEASSLYPDVKYKRMDDYLRMFL